LVEDENMAMIPDLQPCDYFPFGKLDCLIAVGWLGKGSAFPRGEVSVEFFRRLCALIQNPWEPVVCAGVHKCEICRSQFSQDGWPAATFENMAVPCASSHNVFVPHAGRTYVAPVLVAHYINAHWYRPPDEFVEAVLNCPEMGSHDYNRILLVNGGRELVRRLKATCDAS
jgi:hypothetical protein